MRTLQNVDRIEAFIQKHVDIITEVLKKLDSVNPINNQIRQDNDFIKQITQKIEEANAIRDETMKHKQKLEHYIDEVNRVLDPLNNLGAREVYSQPEIESIAKKIGQIDVKLNSLEDLVAPNNLKLNKL